MIILKCIGFLLLGLLGLLLFLVLLVLFVPLRYEGQASYYEKKPEGWVTLSWLLHLIHVAIRYEEELDIRVKVLGITMFPKKEKPQPEPELEVKEETTESNQVTITEPVIEKKLEKPAEVAQPLPPHEDEEVHESETVPVKQPEAAKEAKVPLKDKFASIKDKLVEAKAFLSDAENKKTLRLIKNELFHLLYQLRPRKLKAYAHFGFKDPYTTGQILSYASMVYALYYRHVTLEPDFENEILEGDIYLKGRFRAATLVRVLLKLLFNKNLRMQVKRFIKR